MILHSKIEGFGSPLLIIHGFLGMLDNWKTLSAQFALQGFQVHSLDMRNHGKSFHSNDFSYEIMVADVQEYCNYHNLTQVAVIGHSMGGKVAMLWAVTQPQQINKLIVADIAPKYYPPHHQTILAALNAVDFSQKPSRKDIDEIFKKYIAEEGVRQFLLKNVYWKTPDTLDFRFNLNVFNQQIEQIGAALPENTHFDKETLFLKGEYSNYITPQDTQTIHQHFPQATIVTIPRAGHWLHAENPTDFYKACIHFLKP